MHSTQDLFDFALESIKNKTQTELNYIQKVLLWEVLNNPQKSYGKIAEEQNYSERYISHTIAPQLWEKLTSVWGEKIGKKNCYVQLSNRLAQKKQLYPSQLSPNQQRISCQLPGSPIPLESPFYIERSPIESKCYQEILKPGGLLRITSAKKMGKTSLAQRIINRAKQYNFPTVYISLNLVESQLFSSTAKFWRWFCANLTRQLKLESQLDDYWDEDMGSLVSCTAYVQDYILPAIDSPILLVLDDVNQLFSFPSLSHEFLALLRSWHEQTNYNVIWQNLRLVTVNSTDCYIALDVNKSPFTVGLCLSLPRFTAAQVEELARQYGVQLSSTELAELMSLLGGFPYLVNLALYHSVFDDIPLTELFSTATSETGIFSQHLHEQLNYLQNYPELETGFQQVLRAQAPVELEQVLAFKLKSLGLVDLNETTATVSCQLYQEYFSYATQLIIGH
ncbi:AAA-like domain-containing protein [Coleofasciculus sp. G2-EDA-02]|uniref:AAA-like domain-containing protein n=1 Tax=Coleofasciculus sp. G2-EDA-02 TaxID=3069529 RepID=UPI00330486D5